MIRFEPVEDKDFKEKTGQIRYIKIKIMKNNEEVGHIFTPSGSGEDIINAIQVCGFAEAFDIWGCGIYKGYKDIQLLFDEGIMGGKDINTDLTKCLRCFRQPCQCENKDSQKIAFNVKTRHEIKERLEINGEVNG